MSKITKSFEEQLNQIAGDKELHTSSLYIFSKMNQEALAAFRSIWPTIPTQRRRDIMQELVEIGEANFEVYFDPVFLLALGDEDAQVRTSAINGLWENEDPSLIGPLVHLLRTDDTVGVRAAAAIALGRFVYLGEVEEIDQHQALLAEEALLETIHLSAEDLEVRRRAIESIAYSSEPAVAQIIENAYYDENEKMQVSAIFAMGRSADPHWRPQVIAELDNENSEIRFEAARASGELEASEAIARLVEMIEDDPDLQVQEMAVWALGRIGGPAAREALEECLESEVESIALAAEEALDELNLFTDSFDLFDFEEDDDDDDWFDYDDTNGSAQPKQGGYLH
ncbi:MAG: HEAT repeat domain-containing protein [Anaerolineae bacterium]|nr:HEAT repeat domain-containing protein [Anaerolineae bacterium]